MNFDKFKKTCVEHYEEIVNAFCESASSYNIVFPKNEVEYTYYFENNDDNRYSFIITGETFYNDLTGTASLVIIMDNEEKEVRCRLNIQYDYYGVNVHDKGPKFTENFKIEDSYSNFETNEFWQLLADNISLITY